MTASRRNQIFFAIVIIYFVARVFFVATKVDPQIPPDETTHIGLCQVFSETLLPPENTTESYPYGLVTNVPAAYYFIMGQLLHFNVFFDSDLIYLRLLNVILSCATIGFSWKWIKEVTQNQYAQLLFIVMLTNTMMWTFLAGTVSYDNLANLTAAASLYYLFHFFNSRKASSFVGFMLAMGVAGLTKSTMLPFGFALCVLFLIREGKAMLGLLNRPALFLQWYTKPVAMGFVFALGLWAGNVYLYGGNYLKFGHLVPRPHQVLSEAELMQNRVLARDNIVFEFRSKKITFEQAIAKIQQISHKEDQKGAFQLIYFSQQLRNKEIETAGWAPFLNFLGRWCGTLAQGTYGILGHQILYQPIHEMLPVYLLWATAVGLFFTMQSDPATRHNRQVGNWSLLYASLGIFLFYLAVLFYTNYRTYLATAHPSLSVQGRYLFPVLIPIYGWAACQLTGYGPKWFRVALFAIVAAGFIYFDFPYFWNHLPDGWLVAS